MQDAYTPAPGQNTSMPFDIFSIYSIEFDVPGG
jgi:hypothetical protein